VVNQYGVTLCQGGAFFLLRVWSMNSRGGCFLVGGDIVSGCLVVGGGVFGRWYCVNVCFT